uniref:Uncharacterized protein n=1 Tax=Pseudomonas putida TaxID=303 RepID=A0A6B7Q4W9_PSEPU|nr:hypothetical protein [Pseudomonas putida]
MAQAAAKRQHHECPGESHADFRFCTPVDSPPDTRSYGPCNCGQMAHQRQRSATNPILNSPKSACWRHHPRCPDHTGKSIHCGHHLADCRLTHHRHGSEILDQLHATFELWPCPFNRAWVEVGEVDAAGVQTKVNSDYPACRRLSCMVARRYCSSRTLYTVQCTV